VRLSTTHTLAEETLGWDHILGMLQMEYPTPEHATGDAHALTDLVAGVILVETFILYTVVTLWEEGSGGTYPILPPLHTHVVDSYALHN
jgi:hypothetical protein